MRFTQNNKRRAFHQIMSIPIFVLRQPSWLYCGMT
jgi:hypothetical protein